MGTVPLPIKKLNFSLEMACFHAFGAVFFVRVLAPEMLNFLPDEVIWWTLKM